MKFDYIFLRSRVDTIIGQPVIHHGAVRGFSYIDCVDDLLKKHTLSTKAKMSSSVDLGSNARVYIITTEHNINYIISLTEAR